MLTNQVTTKHPYKLLCKHFFSFTYSELHRIYIDLQNERRPLRCDVGPRLRAGGSFRDPAPAVPTHAHRHRSGDRHGAGAVSDTQRIRPPKFPDYEHHRRFARCSVPRPPRLHRRCLAIRPYSLQSGRRVFLEIQSL